MRVVSFVLFVTACAHGPTTPHVTVDAVAAHPALVASPPILSPDHASREDARAWSELADWMCKQAGGAEYGEGLDQKVMPEDVSFSVARTAFFDDGDAKLHTESRAWLAQVAYTFDALPRGARLVVKTTFEDDPRPPQERRAIANDRASAIAAALALGDRVEMHVSVKAWEGSYDGPAVLDPAAGRLTFTIVRP